MSGTRNMSVDKTNKYLHPYTPDVLLDQGILILFLTFLFTKREFDFFYLLLHIGYLGLLNWLVLSEVLFEV